MINRVLIVPFKFVSLIICLLFGVIGILGVMNDLLLEVSETHGLIKESLIEDKQLCLTLQGGRTKYRTVELNEKYIDNLKGKVDPNKKVSIEYSGKVIYSLTADSVPLYTRFDKFKGQLNSYIVIFVVSIFSGWFFRGLCKL